MAWGGQLYLSVLCGWMFTVTGYDQDRYRQLIMTQNERSNLKEAEITYSTVWWNTVYDRHVTVNTSLKDNRDVIKRKRSFENNEYTKHAKDIEEVTGITICAPETAQAK